MRAVRHAPVRERLAVEQDDGVGRRWHRRDRADMDDRRLRAVHRVLWPFCRLGASNHRRQSEKGGGENLEYAHVLTLLRRVSVCKILQPESAL